MADEEDEEENPFFFSCYPRRTYFPRPPPEPSDDATEYDRTLHISPHYALTAITDKNRECYQGAVGRRVRKQAGLTNRWRFLDPLGADLLGSAQALRALTTPVDEHMMQSIIAATEPKPLPSSCCVPKDPYRYQLMTNQFLPNVCSAVVCPCGNLKPLKECPAKLQTTLNASLLPGTVPPIVQDKTQPQDIFTHLTDRYGACRCPDALLHCLDFHWQLHEPFIQKSPILAELYARALSSCQQDGACDHQGATCPLACLRRTPVGTCPVNIYLDDLDPMITPNAMSVALGNLYRDEVDPMNVDLTSIILAAHKIGFEQLIVRCVEWMICGITWETICRYYEAAIKTLRVDLEEACASWLHLNLNTQLSVHLELGQLSVEVLVKTLRCPRLFTRDEFTLFKTMASWLYLQLNPHVQEMPSYSSVVGHFNTFPKGCSVLEREEGCSYLKMFLELRLHGITEMPHIHDLQTMNILPQNWIAKILTSHYYSLMSGGDMSTTIDFEHDSIRRGYLILSEEDHFERTELVPLFGFFFAMKSIRLEGSGNYKFWIERLKPNDPVLTVNEKERETFSMRPDRYVEYRILVQHYNCQRRVVCYDTGKQRQCFGLGHRSHLGKVFEWNQLMEPLYVMAFFYLPPS